MSARGALLLVAISCFISVMIYMTGLNGLLSSFPWSTVDRTWMILMPLVLLICAIICFIEAAVNYNDTPHCSLTENIQELLAGDDPKLDHLDICEGGLRYLRNGNDIMFF